MEYLFSYIVTTKIIKSIDLQCDDIGEGRYERSEIFSGLKLDEFYKITEIDLGECGILEGEREDAFINDGYDFTIAIEVVVTGIKKDTVVPSWFECIIEGLFNMNCNNHKMAFFNLCAGFDNFINDIFDYYLEYYSECVNEKLDLKEKIRSFASREKKLKRKLNQILRELEINKKHGFKELYNLYNIWDKNYTKTRNDIAHGGVYEEEYKLEEVAYVILTIIFSILLHEDLAKNKWKSIIEFEEIE